mmetsp:Transcript_10097/g.22350  ORF Transcript_10097/g.22350 Transcript_10097/m.22350 type:complete len:484 (-) Transcript_10097:185-1636(-)|eukprot:CAMPEP_0206449798 /NCGR_PEP_ID=MMETSP0324_2-20121206/18324_1 /ASSEMBLY_ACC=CAM_ASM_000836 /TAXON_ID=2866 /ORGANISM="Crypthecodinium cohnii, Strain Seligo" /LENGTH=483 /DNA_ID=CAMNT_0053919285 /DNA_START=32 /DNA_END=1483 /DNA_ORIENTATION=-
MPPNRSSILLPACLLLLLLDQPEVVAGRTQDKERSFSLPSVHRSSADADRIRNEASWHVLVGDKVFYAPPMSQLQLSQNAKDYYYTVGSEEALTASMKAHRVGGHGRLHLLHLPEGPQAIEVPRTGDRRASFSAFFQLQSGSDLQGEDFPEYQPSAHSSLQQSSSSSSEETKANEIHVASAVTSDSIKDYLSRLVKIGTDEPTRSWTNPEASKASQDFLLSEFKKLGLKTCVQHFSSGGRDLANVIAYTPGTSSNTLLVGAHYDSRPFDAPAPGAEDNGSGVAVMLAIAKAFMANKPSPKRSVYFLGFAAEEAGLWGSKAFAKALLESDSHELPSECAPKQIDDSFLQKRRLEKSGKTEAVPQHMAIIMDEVGWVTKKYPKQVINFETSDQPGTITLMDTMFHSNTDLNGESALKVVHNGSPFGSDHMSFLDIGVPAVLLINGDDEAYPNYHSSSDTIDNVNFDYAAKVAKVALGGLMRVSQM